MAPCNYLHKEIDEKGLSVHEECINDPEEQFKYLSSSINMRLLHNIQHFHVEEFSDERHIFKNESKIINTQFNPRNPSFFQFFIETKQLEDEIDLIQFG